MSNSEECDSLYLIDGIPSEESVDPEEVYEPYYTDELIYSIKREKLINLYERIKSYAQENGLEWMTNRNSLYNFLLLENCHTDEPIF